MQDRSLNARGATRSIPSSPDRRPGQTRWGIATVEIVVGVGAVYGGYSLLSDAEGLGAKQAWLEGSVFPDYTVPGLFLLVVIGGGMLAAATVTILAPAYAARAAGITAAVLVAWGSIETVTVGWRGMPQLVLVGAFVAAPALLLGVFSTRSLRGKCG
jgi:hypothetical protein